MNKTRPGQLKVTDKTTVCIIGLGYVGLPLLEAFAKHFRVIGFDIDNKVVARLKQNNRNQNVLITREPTKIGQANFIIIAVPTPVTRSKEPDLSYVISAARIAGQNMQKGSIVILESTVYPGVTEDVVKPVLEKESGFQCDRDFKIAYSPERINPGDKEHSLDKITKVVAGMDEETTALVAELYYRVTPNIFKARNIKTAEAAKVIENIQRDLNIALMNELSLIFAKIGLSTKDVLEAASTKWNFHRYSPGLIGGHCIPVDPYYLVYKAKELGYHPQVILAGRAINDSMPRHIANLTIKALNDVGKVIKGSKVLIMGLTYKENVADTRETPVKEIIKELQEYSVDIYGYDPLLGDIEAEFGIKPYDFQLHGHRQHGSSVIARRSPDVIAMSDSDEAISMNSTNPTSPINTIDCIILAVAHDAFKGITLDELRSVMNDSPILIDVRGIFEPARAEQDGFHYRSL